jgi:hypothetical protein
MDQSHSSNRLALFGLDWQLISYAAFHFGYLSKPKAFHQIASLFVGFFASRHLTQASL